MLARLVESKKRCSGSKLSSYSSTSIQHPPKRLRKRGWRKVTGHLIFDMKMDFTRKDRWVLDGYKTPDTIGSNHFGVVSRYSIRITFTYAALNGINVFTEDIKNAYLQDPSSQKYFIICGKEFGLENKSKETLIRRAL